MTGTALATPDDALGIAQAIAAGATTAVAVTRNALDRIDRFDPQIRAFTHVGAERALREAAAIDALRESGVPLPPLAGVPYAVKNLFDIEGVTTLAGSRVLERDPPAVHDAVLVTQMAKSGAVLLGALNMDEFAYGFTTENHHHGACRNPRDIARTAGGSSGGSAAAVAAGFVPLTLGSDTNGSIRVPASCCGVFGIKPTYGRLSRRGSFPFVASLDHLGAFAGNVADLRAVYNALQFADPQDPACAPHAVEPLSDAPFERPLRVARLTGYFDENAGEEARTAAIEAAHALGSIGTAEFAQASAARGAAFVISAAEGGELHLRNLKTAYADREPLSRDRFLAGALLPAAWVMHAQRVRAVLRREFIALFADYDVLIAPATPVVAPGIGQEHISIGGRSMAARPNLGLLAQPLSCLGMPVVTVPLRTAAGMPIGVQMIAAPWREDLAFAAARRLEEAGLAKGAPESRFR
jgi:AtzE family amidohydrolase